MEQRIGSANIDVVATWVELLRDLEREVQAATSAIGCNQLTYLEESLWRQETLCGRLKRSITAICPATPGGTSRASLREAASRLKTQTAIYEKLVVQSSRSTAILQHLCSLYRNAAQHPGRAIYSSISHEA
jgi:hypothetical protein